MVIGAMNRTNQSRAAPIRPRRKPASPNTKPRSSRQQTTHHRLTQAQSRIDFPIVLAKCSQRLRNVASSHGLCPLVDLSLRSHQGCNAPMAL